MQARRFHAAACLTALGVSAASATGCDRAAVERAAPAATASAPPAARVSVVKPERATVRRTAEQPGQVDAYETTPVYAKLAGYVDRVAVHIGDAVKKGQVLAELRAPEAEADVAQKRAAVKQAEAEKRQSASAVEVAEAGVANARAKVEELRSGVRRSEADVKRWQSEYARVDQLFRERALTGTLLDETKSKLDAAEAGRDEVKARVRSAEAALAEANALRDKARADLDVAASHIDVARAEAEHAEAMAGYLKVVAPFDGVVTRRVVDTGHLTTPGSAGAPMFVVARSDVVTVTVGVPETDAPFVNPGDPARVRLQALDGKAFEGKVTRTSWSLDPATRTLRAEIDLPNTGGLLRPGLYAYATVVAEERKDVLTVPAAAVVSEGGKTYCVTVEGGRARRKEVKTGLSDGKRTEVVSGLGESEPVVEANAATLADGQPIEVSGPKAKN